MTPPKCIRQTRYATREEAAAWPGTDTPRPCPHCNGWHLHPTENRTFRLTTNQGRAIIAGRKTTHRIPAGRTRPCPYAEGGTCQLEYEQIIEGAPPRKDGTPRATYQTGMTVTVTNITRRTLQDALTDDNAHTEGFADWVHMQDQWLEQHYQGDLDRLERAMNRDVWVLHIEAHPTDLDRFLAPAAGYTTNLALAIDKLPVRDEASAEHWAAVAARKNQLQHKRNKLDRSNLDAEQRIVNARAQAKLRGIDTTREARIARHLLDQGKDKAAVQAIRKLEDRSYPKAA